MTSDFDPRRAALVHAGEASRCSRAGSIPAMVAAEAVNAVVCALVYVGDQIGYLRGGGDGGTGD